jgi:hypothetical protein
MADYKELYGKFMVECARVHPTYTADQIAEWAHFSAKHHVNRARKQKVIAVMPWADVLLWLWRAGVLILLIEIVQCLRLR